MDRNKGRRRLDKGKTNSKPPFRPTCHYNRGALPPLNDYESFLKEHRRFYDSARKLHEAVVAADRDAAASRHSKCLAHSGVSSLGSGYTSSMGLEPAASANILGRRLAVARRRRVATKSTPPVGDGSAGESKPEECDELLHSKTATCASQNAITTDVKTKERNQKRRSSSTLAGISIGTDSPKAKSPRLDAKESVTARPTDVGEESVEPQESTGADSRSITAMPTDDVNAHAQLPDTSGGVWRLVRRALAFFFSVVLPGDCERSVEAKIDRKLITCKCLTACEVHYYQTTSSALTWTSQVMNPEGSELPPREGKGIHVRVVVFMRSTKVLYKSKEPKLTLSNLFRNIGGLMGVYLGYSSLQIFHVLDVLVDGAYSSLSGIWSRYTRNRQRKRGLAHLRRRAYPLPEEARYPVTTQPTPYYAL